MSVTAQLSQADYDSMMAGIKAVVDKYITPVTPPAVVPEDLKATFTADSITLNWTPVSNKTLDGSMVARTGVDRDNFGPWAEDVGASVRSYTFSKLNPLTQYTVKVVLYYTDGTSKTLYMLVTTAAKVISTSTGAVTWSSGAYTDHDPIQGVAFANMRNRPLANASMFPTRSGSTADLESTWWIDNAGNVPDIAVGMPMSIGGGLQQDLSGSMIFIANEMKRTGKRFFIRLGWEMNLPFGSDRTFSVNDGNLSLWRQRWSQYYDIFHGILGPKGPVGLNPNAGDQQSGISGEWVDRIWVDGKVDFCGPDDYDWYGPWNTTVNINDHLNKKYGTKWWAAKARAKGVKLAFPEWGLSALSGSAGSNGGGDNPLYIKAITDVMKAEADNMLFDSYFNETQSYLGSDLINHNPKGRAAYRLAMSL